MGRARSGLECDVRAGAGQAALTKNTFQQFPSTPPFDAQTQSSLPLPGSGREAGSIREQPLRLALTSTALLARSTDRNKQTLGRRTLGS